MTIEGAKDVSFSKKVGDEAVAIRSSIDRVGFVIAQGENQQDAISACKRMMDSIQLLSNNVI